VAAGSVFDGGVCPAKVGPSAQLAVDLLGVGADWPGRRGPPQSRVGEVGVDRGSERVAESGRRRSVEDLVVVNEHPRAAPARMIKAVAIRLRPNLNGSLVVHRDAGEIGLLAFLRPPQIHLYQSTQVGESLGLCHTPRSGDSPRITRFRHGTSLCTRARTRRVR